MYTIWEPGHRQGGGAGGNAPGRNFSGERHFWWKEGIANCLSRMNLKLDLGLGYRVWLRLDVPYVPGLARTVPV